MFGISLPSISDVKSAVTGAASSALHTSEDLGASAVSHAASLGRSGLDLGRSAVSALGHADVQTLGSAAIAGIGKAEHWAQDGVQSGVMKAGQGVHAAADYARVHVPGGDNPISNAARGAITAGEDLTRFDIGVVGGVAKAGVGLVGSAGQLGVLATEYQVSPSARAAIDAKVAGGVTGAAKSVAGYADSVAHDPTRVFGDAAHVAGATGGWVKGEVQSAEQAIKDGHGPESFGLQVGNAATYLIPVGGEVRAAAEVGEVATRGLVTALGEDATRSATQDAARTLGAGGVRGPAEATSSEATEAVAAEAGHAALADVGGVLDGAVRGSSTVAQARTALSNLPMADRLTALKSFAGRMDVSTAKDAATFWSGGMKTADTFVSSRAAAETLAKAEGRATLESTKGGRVLDDLQLFDKNAPLLDSPDDAMQIWEMASARYAQAATGDVVAVSENARPTSVWNRIERPILEQGQQDGRIEKIEIRSPQSPYTP